MLEKTNEQKWSILYLWEQFGAECDPRPVWGTGWLAVAGWPAVTGCLAGRGWRAGRGWLGGWLANGILQKY